MLKKVLIVLAVLVAIDLLAVYLFPGAAYQLAMDVERALAGLHTRQIEIDGISYAYTDSDEGEPLLLLHGFTADKDHWTRVARHLTDDFRVIAPDLPGFGASTRDPALDYSVIAQVERVAAFAAALGLERFHLGGSSMGGAIAAVYASRYPQQVQSLWLLAPGGVITDEASEMERILFVGADHPLIPRNRAEFEATLDFVFEKRPFLPGPLRRHLSEVAAERQDLRRQIFADLLNDPECSVRTPINDVVTGSEVPALIVWGRLDRVLHPSGAAKLAELMNNETVELMPDVGHLPMLEAPRATAQRYLDFASGL